jgi:hypothetical protein
VSGVVLRGAPTPPPTASETPAATPAASPEGAVPTPAPTTPPMPPGIVLDPADAEEIFVLTTRGTPVTIK